MNFKKNKFYFKSLVLFIGLLLHLTGFNVFAGPGDDFAQASTDSPGKELVPVSPGTYTAGSKDLGKDLPLALKEIDIANSGEYLAPALPGTDTAVPGNSGENLAPASPDADNVDLEKKVVLISRNIHNTSRKTPLIIAVEEGEFDRVKCLCENGADVNQKDESGNTPFMLAHKNGNKAIEDYLLEKMAPSNKPAALLLAIRNGHLDTATTLLENMDDIINEFSLITLDEASEKSYYGITSSMLSIIIKGKH